MVEARWFSSKSLPTSDEYLRNGIVSTGVHVVLVHMFFLLGCGPTEESASLIDDNQGIINSVATILRLWDDLGSAQVQIYHSRQIIFIPFDSFFCFLKLAISQKMIPFWNDIISYQHLLLIRFNSITGWESRWPWRIILELLHKRTPTLFSSNYTRAHYAHDFRYMEASK